LRIAGAARIRAEQVVDESDAKGAHRAGG
jgi:hypothetical protein